MKITEVRIFPTESRDGKLKAFATMTFDDWFVIRNVKVIQGNNGLFVAMPSRKAMDSCPKCRFKNAVGSKYCNQCGSQIEKQEERRQENSDERQASHMDIAHPVTQECRVYIQERVIEAYIKEAEARTITETTLDNKTSVDNEQVSNDQTVQEQEDDTVGIEDTRDIVL
ncbi:MAG: SpoVG family protein [Candidatus Omnitrophota bacterium]